MASRSAMSEVNKGLMSVLAEIRQKNLFVFLVLPCFFELDKYAAIWRSRGLLHVYTGENFERGKLSFYNQERKKTLYVLGKKFYSYRKPPPNFFCSFSKGYAVDSEEYTKKKLEALRGYSNKERTPTNHDLKRVNKLRREKNILLKIIMDKERPTNREVARRLGCSKTTLYTNYDIITDELNSLEKADLELRQALNGTRTLERGDISPKTEE